MRLQEVLSGTNIEEVSGGLGVDVKNIQFDSALAGPGTLFVCLPGSHYDGHNYAEAAVAAGACAVVSQRLLPVAAPQIVVKDTRRELAVMCANLSGRPADKLTIVTVTGTNGKTSITYLLRGILKAAGIPCGVIGTLGTLVDTKKVPSTLTTPDPTQLHPLLAEMTGAGVKVCIMEASAHAIYLRKLHGIRAEVGIFTNLSQDHLDYFRTMEDYIKVKKSYFTPQNCKYALVNSDDAAGLDISRTSECDVLTYGEKNPADIFGVNFVNTKRGLKYVINAFDEVADVRCGLHGRFNMYNTLAAIGAARILGVPLSTCIKGIKSVSRVEGRFNVLSGERGFKVVIDYAHTPDGLKNVLEAAREMCGGRLIAVFGCGGNRDRSKRAAMGAIASKYADFCVVTSDNPRFEDPFEIMREIETGLKKQSSSYIMVENRSRAIAYAVSSAAAGDVVIVCGKGGEDYQEIAGVKYPYNDEDVVKGLLGKGG